MEVGCYSIDLYCDTEDCFCKSSNQHVYEFQYAGYDRAICRRQAKRVGWKIFKGKVTCPRCAQGYPLMTIDEYYENYPKSDVHGFIAEK